MTWIFCYLAVGAALGGGVVFFCNNRCPTYGELLTGILVGAVVWPLGILVSIVGAVCLAGERIAESVLATKFKRWLMTPICKKLT